MQKRLIEAASALLASGEVARVLGWKTGEFAYDVAPAVFTTVEELSRDFVYGDFCGANLSKYLIKYSSAEGRTLVFLKPCDTYSFNELICEHRIDRDKIYAVKVGCAGMADPLKINGLDIGGIRNIKSDGDFFVIDAVSGETKIPKSDVLLMKCGYCKGTADVKFDDVIGDELTPPEMSDRFGEVAKIEAMSSEERFDFFRDELSRCIRCNACRNVCPACSCEKCVFDNPDSGIASKAAADSFEENMFHIIRAFHVAGRCTDCGECSRVCPERIPLHLLNRKFISDINALYGEHQAGERDDMRAPLVNYSTGDAEPSDVTSGKR